MHKERKNGQKVVGGMPHSYWKQVVARARFPVRKPFPEPVVAIEKLSINNAQALAPALESSGWKECWGIVIQNKNMFRKSDFEFLVNAALNSGQNGAQRSAITYCTSRHSIWWVRYEKGHRKKYALKRKRLGEAKEELVDALQSLVKDSGVHMRLARGQLLAHMVYSWKFARNGIIFFGTVGALGGGLVAWGIDLMATVEHSKMALAWHILANIGEGAMVLVGLGVALAGLEIARIVAKGIKAARKSYNVLKKEAKENGD